MMFTCGAGKRMRSVLARWWMMKASCRLLLINFSPSPTQKRSGFSSTWNNCCCLKPQKRMEQGQNSLFKNLIICLLRIFALILICYNIGLTCYSLLLRFGHPLTCLAPVLALQGPHFRKLPGKGSSLSLLTAWRIGIGLEIFHIKFQEHS